MPALVLLVAFWSLTLLTGCGATAARDAPSSSVLVMPAAAGGSGALYGDFAAAPGVDRFIRRMERQHGFSPAHTAAVLSRAQRKQSIIELMDRQAPRRSKGPNGAWSRYRAKFVTPDMIAKGAAFWLRHAAALDRAESRYGVPADYIVAIMGVETRFGGYLGKTRIIDALATLAFAYPRRADYFTDELEAFLVMVRDEGMDPFQPRGSFAGAMGLGQFMPSSFQRYAVDFTGDGRRDLWNPVDTIGSVANYFKAHGWREGERVAVRARVRPGAATGLKTGFDSRYEVEDLARRGISPVGPLGGVRRVSLLELDARGGYQYWLGLTNFYVITRYNHSTYYAMAVHQLAAAIRAHRGGWDRVRVSTAASRDRL